MIRRLVTLIAVLSLLLCVATVLLWVRSYWVADGFLRQSGAWTVFTGTSRGTLCELRTVPLPNRSVGLTFGYRRQPAYPVTRHRPLTGEPGVRHHGGALGFEWFVTDGGTRRIGTFVHRH